jgi:predicted RNA-binding Zn ribbon-like protein
MAKPENPLSGLSLAGGRLCLDFTNTVGWRGGENRYDHLNGYPDLVWWGLHAGAIGAAEAELLLRKAAAKPEAAARELERAREVREAMYRVFSDLTARGWVAGEDLETLNGALAAALAQVRLEPGEEGLVWGWSGADSLSRVLWPVVRSAAELLTSQELERVGECAGERCGWLYLDVSKNRSRRWCDMRDCGNRAKARRHYERAKRAREVGTGN